MSGSMGRAQDAGSSAYHATQLAQLFVEAVSQQPNVKVKVLGHSGDNEDNNRGGAFYRIWEPGDSLDRLSILSNAMLYCENYDGWAIAWAGQMLRNEMADQKLLIVLSDGQPVASSYGGLAARNHVRRVTDRLDRAGVTVVQVAVGGDLREEDQAHMFKHYIMAPSGSWVSSFFPTTLRKLTKLLRKVLA